MTYFETRKTHTYRAYGMLLPGYGSSMDPHRCGDPDEPCVTVTEQREVSDWKVVKTETIGTFTKP
jgi:hypothetical protein